MDPMTLPTELTDKIITHIAHDKLSLLSCAAVCRSWVSTSRGHYFRDFPPKISSRDLIEFVEILKSPFSTFNDHLCSLEICERWLYDLAAEELQSNTELSPDRPILVGLKHLSLTELPGERIAHLNSTPLFSYLSNITTLQLGWLKTKSFSVLATLLSSLTLLETLSLAFVHLDRGDAPQEETPEERPPMCLQHLSVHYSSQIAHALFEWLLSKERLPPISRLYFEQRIPPAMAGPAVALIRRLGGDLKDLKVCNGGICSGDSSIDAFMLGLNLSANMSLESLSITGLGSHNTWDDNNKPSAPLRSVLSTLNSSSLREISFCITMSSVHFSQQLPFLYLDGVDNLIRYSKLKRIHPAPKITFLFKGTFDGFEEDRISLVKEMVRNSLGQGLDSGVSICFTR